MYGVLHTIGPLRGKPHTAEEVVRGEGGSRKRVKVRGWSLHPSCSGVLLFGQEGALDMPGAIRSF